MRDAPNAPTAAEFPTISPQAEIAALRSMNTRQVEIIGELESALLAARRAEERDPETVAPGEEFDALVESMIGALQLQGWDAERAREWPFINLPDYANGMANRLRRVEEENASLSAALLAARREVEARGIYIASRTRHAERWRALRDDGCPIVSSWIDEAGPGESLDWQELWDRCVAEASNAAALIVYAEDADKYLKGALVEVGAALSHGVPVYLVMGDRNVAGSAWNHRLVTVCESFEDALALALSRAALAAAERPPKPQPICNANEKASSIGEEAGGNSL